MSTTWTYKPNNACSHTSLEFLKLVLHIICWYLFKKPIRTVTSIMIVRAITIQHLKICTGRKVPLSCPDFEDGPWSIWCIDRTLVWTPEVPCPFLFLCHAMQQIFYFLQFQHSEDNDSALTGVGTGTSWQAVENKKGFI
jgi:hypothetical protein